MFKHMRMKTFMGVLFFLNMTTLAWGRDLVIAGIPDEPLRYYDSNKELKGIDVEIVDTILKALGITYKVELESSSPRLDKGWQGNPPVYDMVFTYSKKEERMKFLNYANEPHLDINWNFFIRKEDENKFKFEKLEDLKGYKIGVTKGFSYSPEFLEAGKTFLTFEEIPQNELQIKKVIAGRIDLTPLNTITALYEAKKEGLLDKLSYLKKPLVSKAYFNTFVKASDYPGLMELIPKYDEELRKMKKDGRWQAILNKYGWQ